MAKPDFKELKKLIRSLEMLEASVHDILLDKKNQGVSGESVGTVLIDSFLTNESIRTVPTDSHKMVSKLIVEAAIQTAKLPNQSCPLLFGEVHSDMKLQSEDYQV